MAGNERSEFSAAFDGLLNQNRQRMNDLYGGAPRATVSTATSTATPVPPSVTGKRRAGRMDGQEFTFEV